MGLVNDHPAEVGEEVAPALVVGEDGHVQHVRVGQDQVCLAADGRPLLPRGVAVVDRLAQSRRAQLAQLAGLVLGQSLGGVEVERASLGLVRDPVQDRQVEAERLAAGGAAGQDQVRALGDLVGLGLVGVEGLDPDPGQRLGQLG